MEPTDPATTGNCHYCAATLEWGSPHCCNCGHYYLNGFRSEIPWEEYEPLEPLDRFDDERILTGNFTNQEDPAFDATVVEQLQRFNATHPYPPHEPYRCSSPSSQDSPLQPLPPTTQTQTQTQTHPNIIDHRAQPPPSSSYPLPLRTRAQQLRDAEPRRRRGPKRPRRSAPPSPLSPRPQPQPQPPCTEPDCPIKHAAHPTGLYFHNGVRPTAKDVVFGFAEPPPGVAGGDGADLGEVSAGGGFAGCAAIY